MTKKVTRIRINHNPYTNKTLIWINDIETAIKMAVESPLLETTVKGSSDIIIFVRGKVTLKDSEIIGDYIADLIGSDANVIYGITVDESMGDTLSASLMAMGMEA